MPTDLGKGRAVESASDQDLLWALRGSNPRPPACKYDADGSRRTATSPRGRSQPACGQQRTTTNGSDRAINAQWIPQLERPSSGWSDRRVGRSRRERTRVFHDAATLGLAHRSELPLGSRTVQDVGVRRQLVRRSFRQRSQVVALALAVSFALGCGDKNLTESATNPAEGIYGYLRDIVSRAGVGDPDLAAVVSAACAAYADGLRAGDTSTFNEYIADLFNTAEQGGLDQGRVDRAVTEACGSFDGDVRGFVDDLSASLGIGLDELRGYVASACADFGQRRRTNATDPNAPEPFDPLVSSVFAKGGLDRTNLEALVDAACRDFPAPTPPEARAILPNPELTSGDASAPGGLKTWCQPGYAATYPSLSDADRESVLDAYAVPPDKRVNYEVMRLIPTGLGGTNAKTNLFPISRAGSPRAADKAEIDLRLTETVCAAKYGLETARANLVCNWPVALSKTFAPGTGNERPSAQTLPRP
jgi:hypothetical protein